MHSHTRARTFTVICMQQTGRYKWHVEAVYLQRGRQPVATPRHEGRRPPAVSSREMCEMCRYALRLPRYVLLAFYLSISKRNVLVDK